MEVALLTERDYKDSYTGYSTRPDLIKEWVETPGHIPSDELIEHILDLSKADPSGAGMTAEQVKDELDLSGYSRGYADENAVVAIATLLPPLRSILGKPFTVVAEYEGYAY